MGLTANALYGFDPTAQQPTASPVPEHQGAPEPTMATTSSPDVAGAPDRRHVILALVAMVGLVILLTQVSFRGTVAVDA